MNCPKCVKQNLQCDTVDVGVGEIQCGPYVCPPDEGGCGWVQPNCMDEFFIDLCPGCGGVDCPADWCNSIGARA